MRSRSAHSLTLVRYSVFIAFGVDVRRFLQLILSLSNQRKAVEMMAARLSARLLARSAIRVLVPCLVPPCCSKQEAAFSSTRLPACLVPRPRQILRSLSIPSRPSSRLASRRPSRSHAVSLLVPFSSRPVLPDVPHACLQSCGRAVLPSSSRRYPHALPSLPSLPSLPPHAQMTQDGHGHRTTVS